MEFTEKQKTSDRSTETGPTLAILMNITWWVLVAVNLTLFLIAVPVEYRSHIASSTRDFTPALERLRLSPTFYAILRTGLDASTILSFTAIGIVIILRKPRDWMVFLTAIACMTFSTMFIPTLIQLAEAQPVFRVPASFIRMIGLAASVIVFLFLFPNGRFTPRITRWLAAIWAGLSLWWWINPAAPANIVHLTDWNTGMAKTVGLLFGAYSIGVAAQIWRYRTTTDPGQKQQIKWFLYGAVSGLLGFGLYYAGLILFPVLSRPDLPRLVYMLVGLPVYHFSILMVPLSLAVAISRFRLWDLDLVINRSLVFSIVTGLIIAGYALAVIILEQFFHLSMGWDRSPLAIALSTLLIAFTFAPLRNIIQARVDRRFYRKKYSDEKAITALSMKLRDEVDINRLAEALLTTIDETMQPEHVSLWLRENLLSADNQGRERYA